MDDFLCDGQPLPFDVADVVVDEVAEGVVEEVLDNQIDKAVYVPISKRQQKKKLKREAKSEMWVISKKQKKKQKKEEKKERKKKERELTCAQDVENLTPEQIEEKKNLQNTFIANKRQYKAEQKERLVNIHQRRDLDTVITLCVDCNFNDKMNSRENISLASQLQSCYAANSRADNPVFLSFTSLVSPVTDHLNKIEGSGNWILDKSSNHFTTHFSDRLEKMIYLTADSENELTTLEPGMCYVIGGIVDRNRHKNICLEEAIKYNVKTAKLPIGQFLKEMDYVIMTTNQCVSMLITYCQNKDWSAAVQQAIPQRKVNKVSTTSSDSQ
ncbi:tRNA (guanine(9)-N1)-methyltransferase [Acrasis kona]|uniref:tRNA (guanine(9)-N(1))-methyltransferase n=1 Tax=Acrasis kona TaxID=1008807 RepID=A0AAW2YLE1_9EUKA